MQVATRPVDFNVLFNRPTIKGFELRQGIDQFAQHVCSHLRLRDITLEWSNNVPTAMVNQHGTIRVANVRDDAVITHNTLVRYAGFIVHELLHIKYTDFDVQSTRSRPGLQYIATLHNAVEDAWIERTGIASELLGNIEGLLQGLMEQIISEGEAAAPDWSDPNHYPFTLAVYAREYCRRLPVPAALVPVFEEATRRIDTAKSSADTLAIAEWVFDQIQNVENNPDNSRDDDGPTEPCQNPNNQGDNKPQGDKGNEGQDQGQDGQDGQDQGQDAAGDGQGGEGQGQDGQGQGQGEGDGQDGPQDGPQNASEGPTGADQDSGEGKGAAEDSDASNRVPRDAGKAKPAEAWATPREVEPTVQAPNGQSATGTYTLTEILGEPDRHLGGSFWDTTISVPGKLRYEIRRLFDNTSSTQFSPNRKSGSIDNRSLHKFGQTDRLFQLRRDVEGIDSAVVICLDISYSMFEDRLMGPAVKSCAALFDALTSAEVATAVLTFGDYVGESVPFGTRPARAKTILSKVCQGGGTNDYVAVRHAHDMLRRRPEFRKICFVITDGAGHRTATRQQCESGEAFGIKTIGVGIGFDVSGVYPDAVCIDKVEDLAQVSFQKIKACI